MRKDAVDKELNCIRLNWNRHGGDEVSVKRKDYIPFVTRQRSWTCASSVP